MTGSEKTKQLIAVPYLRNWVVGLSVPSLKKVTLHTFLIDTHGVYDTALSSDEKLLYVSCSDKRIRVYETKNLTIVKEYFSDYSSDKIALIRVKGVDYLCVSAHEGIRLLRTNDFSLLDSTQVGGEIEKMIEVDDGVAIGYSDGKVERLTLKQKASSG